MCYFSTTAENSRPAKLGEVLVISESPCGFSRWITAPGEPNTAVCVLPTAKLGVETHPTVIREARFEEDPDATEQFADSIVFLDGNKERLHLYRARLDTRLHVLWLPDEKEEDNEPPVFEAVGSNPMVQDEELVLVGAD